MRAIPDGEKIVRAALERGLDAAALSRLAGVVPATTARAMASKPINVRSFIAITRALAGAKVEPGANGFLRGPINEMKTTAEQSPVVFEQEERYDAPPAD